MVLATHDGSALQEDPAALDRTPILPRQVVIPAVKAAAFRKGSNDVVDPDQ